MFEIQLSDNESIYFCVLKRMIEIFCSGVCFLALHAAR